MSDTYLAPGLPRPVPSPDGLDAPFWAGLRDNELRLQCCLGCDRFQWGPEWLCHRCLGEDLGYRAVPAEGVIYSYERVWHPVHPALKAQGPYLVVLVSLPVADDVRLIGNLLGDPHQVVEIGAAVHGVFEHHDGDPPFTLLQWQVSG